MAGARGPGGGVPTGAMAPPYRTARATVFTAPKCGLSDSWMMPDAAIWGCADSSCKLLTGANGTPAATNTRPHCALNLPTITGSRTAINDE